MPLVNEAFVTIVVDTLQQTGKSKCPRSSYEIMMNITFVILLICCDGTMLCVGRYSSSIQYLSAVPVNGFR